MDKKEYATGDFIFAKVKGYSAWPARVQQSNGKKYLVYFYGTGQIANLPPSQIFDYVENKDKFLMKTFKRKDFNEAVEQIEYDFANKVPLEKIIGDPVFTNLAPPKRTIKRQKQRKVAKKRRDEAGGLRPPQATSAKRSRILKKVARLGQFLVEPLYVIRSIKRFKKITALASLTPPTAIFDIKTTVEDNDPLLISSVIKPEPKISPDLELIKSQVESWRVILQQLPTNTHTDTRQEPLQVDETDPRDVTTQHITERSEEHGMEDTKYVTLPSKLCKTNIEIAKKGDMADTETEDVADTIDAGIKYEETKTEDVTDMSDTETVDVADTIDAGIKYEETKTEDVTDMSDTETEDVADTLDAETETELVTGTEAEDVADIKTEDVADTETEDVADTLDAETETELVTGTEAEDVADIKTEDVADTIDTWPVNEETETKYITHNLDILPIYEETEMDDDTDTLDVVMENDSPEAELNNIPGNNNEEVINSDIRDDPCTSVDLETIKKQVVLWRVILHRQPTDTLPANIMSSGASDTICDGTNNIRIKETEDVPRVEALHEVTDCTSKENGKNGSRKDKVMNKTITVFKIPKQKKIVSVSYICDYCKQKFNTKIKLQQHISIHYGVSEVNITCQTCNYKGDTVQALEKHSRLHDEKRRFKCNSCTYRFSSNTLLMQHVWTHTGKKQDNCDLCDYASSQSGNLKSHMRKHTGEKPYKCDLCDYASSHSGALKRHMSIHTGEKQYKCDLCVYASSNIGNLKTHMRVHTGEKKYNCDLCDYASSNSVRLKRHMRKHTGEKQYKCDSCNFASSRSDNLKQHMKKHTRENPYKCELCGYVSSFSSSLKRHMSIHTGLKKYNCDLCYYASSNRGHLKSHMRKHTGDKPYKCDLCDSASSYSGHLKRHMRIHTTREKQYKCDLCDYRCSDRRALSKHKKRLHAASSAT